MTEHILKIKYYEQKIVLITPTSYQIRMLTLPAMLGTGDSGLPEFLKHVPRTLFIDDFKATIERYDAKRDTYYYRKQ
jgi:hypothetical protein